MKKCTKCGESIPAGRLKALPTATTCVKCSSETPFGVNVVQNGELERDGFQEIEIIRDPSILEDLRRYKKELGTYQES